MAEVWIEHEQEVESGWQFAVRVVGSGSAGPVNLTLTMSWADYDYWSGGTEPPSETARQVVEYVLAHRPATELPARFDAATARRWLPQIDAALGRSR